MLEFLMLLSKHQVRYVIVGGKAVIYYGFVRLTGDIDFFYESSKDNASRLFSVLSEFWNGNIPGINSWDELIGDDLIIQFGRPPNRIDLITSVESVNFNEAWKNRCIESVKIEGRNYPLYFLGIDQLIKNKESVNRDKDRMDLKYLRALKKKINKS